MLSLLPTTAQSVPAVQQAASTDSCWPGAAVNHGSVNQTLISFQPRGLLETVAIGLPITTFATFAAAGALASKATGFQPVFAHIRFFGDHWTDLNLPQRLPRGFGQKAGPAGSSGSGRLVDTANQVARQGDVDLLRLAFHAGRIHFHHRPDAARIIRV